MQKKQECWMEMILCVAQTQPWSEKVLFDGAFARYALGIRRSFILNFNEFLLPLPFFHPAESFSISLSIIWRLFSENGFNSISIVVPWSFPPPPHLAALIRLVWASSGTTIRMWLEARTIIHLPPLLWGFDENKFSAPLGNVREAWILMTSGGCGEGELKFIQMRNYLEWKFNCCPGVGSVSARLCLLVIVMYHPMCVIERFQL